MRDTDVWFRTRATQQDYAAATLITPELGGLLQIFTPEGVGFTLAIPTNAVFVPTLARMTLITNLVWIPAATGFLSAVQLEPAGRWSAARNKSSSTVGPVGRTVGWSSNSSAWSGNGSSWA